MADTTSVKLFIPGKGHLFYGDVDQPAFDIDAFKFGDESTYTTTVDATETVARPWTWMGDLSKDSLIEFSVNGGEATQKHTWSRDGVKTIYSSEELSGTAQALNISREMFELAFPGGTYNEAKKSYTVGKVAASKKGLLLVAEDGLDVMAFRFMQADIKGQFPSFSTEEFMQIPLNMQLLSSLAEPNARFEIFEPRPYSTA